MNQSSPFIQSPTIQQVLSLASTHGLTLQGESLSLNESGLDFLVAIARDQTDNSWVLRIPRRSDVGEKAIYENRALTLVSQHLPVAVPEWKVNTEQLIAYRLLPGTPAATIDPQVKQYQWHLDPANLAAAFTTSLSHTLVALHSIDPKEAAQGGIRVTPAKGLRTTLQLKMEQVQQEMGVCKALWQSWQEWVGEDSYWPQHTSLVHGDLHAGHILVDTQSRVSGLIDWTEAEVGDPAIDFVPYLATFGQQALSTLLTGYEQAGGKVWPRMKEHIVRQQGAYGINIALFALQSGVEEYLQMAKVALGVDK
ncbi:macrolide 2'-phosphotransferase [Rhodocytophaga aerolata]|uniref:Macrolide 2'-phosphotransferase n=2 Tax=Rhodocytophaga aerolata TaxID=455078 RepID=A0ABT8RHR3_9BACT|nr:macrolide 2'-phosphotransferase [Rhodocytophaga aerolata]MDO1450237.1 macrolide 2'-phosphotransferase [Rhodocytophaga aerolata]